MVRRFGKNNNIFEHKIFFVGMKYFFYATLTRFCQRQITFCATSSFLFRYKTVFRATPNFCFGHRLESYVMVI